MKWSDTFYIPFVDTDASGILSPASALRLMEESGNNQIKSSHPNWDELAAKNQAFLLSCLRMHYYKPILAYDNIQVNTWACPSKGVFFNRCYQITRNGEPLAEVNTIWALVDLTDRHIYKVNEIELDYLMDDQLVLDKPTQTRIPNTVSLEKIGDHTVRYSETDYIHHMNNTRYLDLLCDCVPGIDSSFVKSIGIKYRAEAPLGEKLKIYRGQVGNTYYFRTIREDGQVNVEAEIEIEAR